MDTKSYCELLNEITANDLYEGLLAYGFFADKIPPLFTSIPFFEYCQKNSPNCSSKWNEFITFRSMRNIGIPRFMSIPNPFRYQSLCSILRDNWANILKHFQEQTNGQYYRISRIHIRKEYGEKRIFEMNYKNWRVDGTPESELLINDKGTSRFIVKADISSCFPSIYTHAIPWAIVGKEEAKKNISKNTLWYNVIDKACSDMCNGETHGLPIGPHSSNLLSEIILTVVDKTLYNKGHRFIRNIDDYDCYVSSHEEAQLFLTDLEEELLKFDLPLNHKKTKIIELPIGFDKNWKHMLNDLPKTGGSGMIEFPQINTFIDTSLTLANETHDFAIVKYTIKKLKGLNITPNGQKQAAKRFMHMAILYPYLLHLMEDYVFTPYKVDKIEIKAFSDTIYQDAKKTNNYESICYAIYFALRYDFVLDAFEKDYTTEQNYIFNGKDCITLTLTWLYFMKQNKFKRTATQVKPINKFAKQLAKNEMDLYWLFCYEALTAGSLQNEWNLLKKSKVSFIRENLLNL